MSTSPFSTGLAEGVADALSKAMNASSSLSSSAALFGDALEMRPRPAPAPPRPRPLLPRMEPTLLLWIKDVLALTWA